jgi:hypothetical protein
MKWRLIFQCVLAKFSYRTYRKFNWQFAKLCAYIISKWNIKWRLVFQCAFTSCCCMQIYVDEASRSRKLLHNGLTVEMSSSCNFSARASPSYEGSEPSQAGALQFSSWNWALIKYYKEISKFSTSIMNITNSNQLYDHLPYASHYKPQLVFFFTQFSLWLRLILQTIYVLKKEILHFLSSKSAAYKQERLQNSKLHYLLL